MPWTRPCWRSWGGRWSWSRTGPPDRPADEIQIVIRDLRVARSGLVRDRTALRNRLAAARLPLVRRLVKARLAQAERQIAALDAEIDACLDTCPKRRRTVQILTSIPGIGRITARTILAECPEIGTLRHKQIAALAGLAPMTRQSGTWQGKARIQGGRRHLREALFMPALVAMKKNPDLSAQYDRMRADSAQGARPPPSASGHTPPYESFARPCAALRTP